MKWNKIKDTVARGVYTQIKDCRSYDTMAVILIDKCLGLGAKPKLCSNLHNEVFKEYADKAWDVVQNWDVRCVGRLRDLFPQHFPPSLLKGNLVACYDQDGEWSIAAQQIS